MVQQSRKTGLKGNILWLRPTGGQSRPNSQKQAFRETHAYMTEYY